MAMEKTGSMCITCRLLSMTWFSNSSAFFPRPKCAAKTVKTACIRRHEAAPSRILSKRYLVEMFRVRNILSARVVSITRQDTTVATIMIAEWSLFVHPYRGANTVLFEAAVIPRLDGGRFLTSSELTLKSSRGYKWLIDHISTPGSWEIRRDLHRSMSLSGFHWLFGASLLAQLITQM